jgi:hypothetical protein
LPEELLTYVLLNSPTNAQISAAGVVTWTPDESQAPSTNTFTVVVTDNGGLSATNQFVVVATEVNVAPTFIATPSNVALAPLAVFSVTNAATDVDLPAQTLVYSLINPPAGAVVSSNGVISWTPAEAQAGSTNELITVVSDGALSVTNSFVVTVSSVTNEVLFEITSLHITNGVATVTWNSVSNVSYVLQYKDDLTSPTWIDVLPSVVANGSSTSMTNVLGSSPQRFFRVRLGTAAPPVVPAPVIQSLLVTNGTAVITWTSVSNVNYRLQFKTNLLEVTWTSVVPDTLAVGPLTTATNLVGEDPQRFYRVVVP